MKNTYTQHANICAKFYSLTLDALTVGQFIFQASRSTPGDKILFVGSMFDIAKYLIGKGLDLTLVDYTDEMVKLAKIALPQIRIEKADIKAMPFEQEFDLIFVVGRVFTHMISETDLLLAIKSCKRALKPNGKLFVDNYEDSRIQKTSYFNGKISCQNETCKIIRNSTTTLLSQIPFVVKWDAKYSGNFEGTDFEFSDTMEHRAFSRKEFGDALVKSGLKVLEQGDNFDETSFYTLAARP